MKLKRNTTISSMAALNKREDTKHIVVHAIQAESNFTIFNLKGIDGVVRYHFVVEQEGTFTVGLPIDSIGSHTKLNNSETVSIAVIMDQGEVTHEQYVTLQSLCITLQELYGCEIVCASDIECELSSIELAPINKRLK